MAKKRIHSNGRYAKKYWIEEEGYVLCRGNTHKWRIGEQQLKDFWFEPVPDVYEECAFDIDDANMGMLHLETIEEILKKHFSKFVDSNE